MTRGPIETIEEGLHLLRRVPAGVWVWQWSGSAPFALGAIFFWELATNPRTSAATLAAAALGMAILLTWMSCCRALFAGRLRELLSDIPESGQGGRLGSLLPAQSLLGASKLLVMPFSTLIVFPLAAVTAFYRYATALGSENFARARKLAGIEPGQSWMLLLLLQFCWLVLAINIAIGLAALPHLVRILTGVESSFTRSGLFYIFNPLFGILVLMVTWLAFDPLIQAVYTVRCFHLQSLETGEDLRAGLRRIRDAARVAAGCLVLLVAGGAYAHAAIPPDRLEEAIRKTEKSPEYDWRLPAAQAPRGESWVAQAVEGIWERVRSGFQAINRAISRGLRWLVDRLRGTPLGPSGAGAPPAGVPASTWVLTMVAAGAAGWLAWRWLRGWRPAAAPLAVPAVVAARLDADDISPDRLPEEQWIELAEQCLREQNYRLAMRALYLANLAWLGQRELLSLHAAKTNREYEAELRRRGRAFPQARGLFSANILEFERAWYGTRGVSLEDIGEFRGRVDQMKRLVTV